MMHFVTLSIWFHFSHQGKECTVLKILLCALLRWRIQSTFDETWSGKFQERERRRLRMLCQPSILWTYSQQQLLFHSLLITNINSVSIENADFSSISLFSFLYSFGVSRHEWSPAPIFATMHRGSRGCFWNECCTVGGAVAALRWIASLHPLINAVNEAG